MTTDSVIEPNAGLVTRLRLNDQVAAHVREEILSGELRPGTLLPQNDWAKRLGTSRMPVRDAFIRLQSEGLITVQDNGIAHVADLSEEDISDAYQLNALAAGIAAQRSAERMSQAAIDELARLHDAFSAAVAKDEVDAATTANNAFHRMLTVESRSPRLIGMMRVLSAGTPHVGTRELSSWRNRSMVSHGRILAAIVAKDPKTVGELMREHVLEASDVIIEYLRSRGFWSDSPD